MSVKTYSLHQLPSVDEHNKILSTKSLGDVPVKNVEIPPLIKSDESAAEYTPFDIEVTEMDILIVYENANSDPDFNQILIETIENEFDEHALYAVEVHIPEEYEEMAELVDLDQEASAENKNDSTPKPRM